MRIWSEMCRARNLMSFNDEIIMFMGCNRCEIDTRCSQICFSFREMFHEVFWRKAGGRGLLEKRECNKMSRSPRRKTSSSICVVFWLDWYQSSITDTTITQQCNYPSDFDWKLFSSLHDVLCWIELRKNLSTIWIRDERHFDSFVIWLKGGKAMSGKVKI